MDWIVGMAEERRLPLLRASNISHRKPGDLHEACSGRDGSNLSYSWTVSQLITLLAYENCKVGVDRHRIKRANRVTCSRPGLGIYDP